MNYHLFDRYYSTEQQSYTSHLYVLNLKYYKLHFSVIFMRITISLDLILDLKLCIVLIFFSNLPGVYDGCMYSKHTPEYLDVIRTSSLHDIAPKTNIQNHPLQVSLIQVPHSIPIFTGQSINIYTLQTSEFRPLGFTHSILSLDTPLIHSEYQSSGP